MPNVVLFAPAVPRQVLASARYGTTVPDQGEGRSAAGIGEGEAEALATPGQACLTLLGQYYLGNEAAMAAGLDGGGSRP
jgi:hypothetical protein